MDREVDIDENAFDLELDDRGLVCLLRTMEINDEVMASSPVLRAIKNQQYSKSDFVSKAIAAFLTACIHQRRIVFCFSADTLGILLSQDANNLKRNTTEVKETEYKHFLKELFNPKRGWFTCLLRSERNKDGKKGHPFIAELRFLAVVEEIERLTGTDADELADQQLEEAKRFAQYNPALDNAVTSIKKIEKGWLGAKQKVDQRQKEGLFRSFQGDLQATIREYLDLTEFNQEYAEKLIERVYLRDKTVKANFDGILKRLMEARKTSNKVL